MTCYARLWHADSVHDHSVPSGGCMVESIMLSFLATLSVHGSSVDEPAVCVRDML